MLQYGLIIFDLSISYSLLFSEMTYQRH